jgi:adenosylcobyric acid synthase
VKGYEIHMGETDRGDAMEAFSGEGAASPDGLVFGTYMHGLFQNVSAVDALLRYLHERKGACYEPLEKDPVGGSEAFDDLAGHFEQHINMDYVLSFFNGGQKSGDGD